MQTADVQRIVEAYNEIIGEVDPLLHLARDRQLQISAAARLRDFLPVISAEKDVAIESGTDREANVLLGLETLARGTVAELEVYILLKQDQPDKAWSRLIDAQTALSAAMRADQSFERMEKRGHLLRELETYLFPPQQFFSAGLIVGRQECSICREEYGGCDHLVGRPYRGRFCYIILKEVTADHVALVDDPANRHCRVTGFSVPGGKRNKMSWVVTLNDLDAPPPDIPEGAMAAEGIMASVTDFGGEWPDEDLPVAPPFNIVG